MHKKFIILIMSELTQFPSFSELDQYNDNSLSNTLFSFDAEPTLETDFLLSADSSFKLTPADVERKINNIDINTHNKFTPKELSLLYTQKAQLENFSLSDEQLSQINASVQKLISNAENRPSIENKHIDNTKNQTYKFKVNYDNTCLVKRKLTEEQYNSRVKSCKLKKTKEIEEIDKQIKKLELLQPKLKKDIYERDRFIRKLKKQKKAQPAAISKYNTILSERLDTNTKPAKFKYITYTLSFNIIIRFKINNIWKSSQTISIVANSVSERHSAFSEVVRNALRENVYNHLENSDGYIDEIANISVDVSDMRLEKVSSYKLSNQTLTYDWYKNNRGLKENCFIGALKTYWPKKYHKYLPEDQEDYTLETFMDILDSNKKNYILVLPGTTIYEENTIKKHRSIPIFLIADNHIEKLTNDIVRKSILNSRNKMQIVNIKQPSSNKYTVISNLTYDILLNSKHKHIATDIDLRKLWCEIAKKENTVYTAWCKSGKVTYLMYKDKQIKYNPNILLTEKIYRLLSVPYNGETIGMLGLRALGKDVLSQLDGELYRIFDHTSVKKGGFKGVFNCKSDKQFISYDRNKQFSWIFSQGNFPVYDTPCTVRLYKNEKIQPFNWYILNKSSNDLPCRGQHLRIGDCVLLDLKNKFYNKSNIKYVIPCSFVLTEKICKAYIIWAKEKLGNDYKWLINHLIGTCGIKKTYTAKFAYMLQTPNDIALAGLNYAEKTSGFIEVSSRVAPKKKFKTGLPIYLAVIQRSDYDIFNLKNEILTKDPEFKLARINVDAVQGYSNKKLILERTKIESVVNVKGINVNIDINNAKSSKSAKSINVANNIYVNSWIDLVPKYSNENDALINIKHQLVSHINNGNSIFISAYGGFGKTNLLKYLLKNLKDAQGCAFTNIAANKLKGKTLHSLLGLDIGGCKTRNIVSGYKILIIDEISMIPKFIWKLLLCIKQAGVIFVLAGDYRQIPAVNEENLDYSNSTILLYLASYYRISLTKCLRNNDNLHLLGWNPKLIDFTYKQCKFSIAYTNAECEKINKDFKWEAGNFVTDGKVIYELASDKDGLFKCDIESEKSSDVSDDLLPANCVTIHKVQGLSINFEYTIVGLKKLIRRSKKNIFVRRLINTAITRATSRNYVCYV